MPQTIESMKRFRPLLILGATLVLSFGVVRLGLRLGHQRNAPPAPPLAPFVVAPYLQLGDAPGLANPERLSLLWQAEDKSLASDWWVEVQTEPGREWVRSESIGSQPISVDVRGIAPHQLYRARLEGLRPGKLFQYRVSYQNKVVFKATGRPRKSPGEPQRIVAFGDAAADTQEQVEVALQVARANPDLVVLTGDLVYMTGTIRDYRRTFFPVYNAETVATDQGAPLLRSIPFAAVPGNHDLLARDLDKIPDALAYFHIWNQPLNGPIVAIGIPVPTGSPEHRRAFREPAGLNYPRMANFSFDSGDVHFTAVDMNAYTDWTNPTWRKWLADDFAAAQTKPWRIVLTHQPPFSSSHAHAEEQRARLIADLVQEGNVQLVLSGHVHNYQRSHPLKFTQTGPMTGTGEVPGSFVFDHQYDGIIHTKPDGPLYVVTGAGGARLYDTNQDAEVGPKSWQPFTQKMISREHSLTILDVTPEALDIKQVNGAGKEIDRFRISR